MIYQQTAIFRGENDALAPSDWPVIEVQQKVPGQLVLTLSDECKDNPSELPEGDVAKLVVKEHPTLPPCIQVDGTYVAADAAYSFDLLDSHVSRPGLFTADLVHYDAPLGSEESPSPHRVRRLYLEIEPNNLAQPGPYPLSVSEMRLILRDECPDQNYLLDDLDYTNKEIVKAIQDVVDTWNETAPQIRLHSYTDFPYRRKWAEGAMGLLLERKGRWMYRNHLNYSAGGISVDDTSRFQVYMQDGARLWQSFTTWMLGEKRRLDMESAFGSTG